MVLPIKASPFSEFRPSYRSNQGKMSRQLKSQEELENSYIDERVKWLLPQFEALAPYKLKQRKKGVGDLEGVYK